MYNVWRDINARTGMYHNRSRRIRRQVPVNAKQRNSLRRAAIEQQRWAEIAAMINLGLLMGEVA